MKTKFLFVLFIGAMTFVSCNKDQKAVKKLSGSWEEVSIDGTPVPEDEKGVTVYNDCKLKNDEYCTGTYTDSEGNSEAFEYKVTGDGSVLTQKVEDPEFGTFEFPLTITELTNDKLVLTISLFGSQTVEYKKI